MQFKELNLNPSILSALEREGYASPTPVQAASIPLILEGKDLLGCAQTGTGKTAAFALPILHLLSRRPVQGPRPVRALILTPTRELALQIQESFAAYGSGLPLRTAVIFGGVGEGPQKAQLRAGVDILVATPGRLQDLMGQGAVHLDRVEMFVLDEADRMLDMGFIHDVRRICQKVPQKRQTLLFSATMPPEIRKLADTLLRNPSTVEVARVSSTAERIDQGVYFVAKDGKASLLRRILADEGMSRVLVFTRTKHGADRVRKTLEAYRIPAEAIHGNKSQNARQRSLSGFKDGSVRVLVATDIAARGIDVDGVSHVINYDLPADPETYVHRIGRTARAGASGVAMSLCAPEDKGDLKTIERLIKKDIRVLEAPVGGDSLPADFRPEPAPRREDQESRGRRDQGHQGNNGRRGEGRNQNHGRPQGNSQGRHPAEAGRGGQRQVQGQSSQDRRPESGDRNGQ
ncbi:MAG TPA: DEAD/DEAH box helicase, partial [Fibrobacteria bacterium]|nr:DEAD/DEAH box helicase [Fibrobacteria bacterium]